MKHQTPVPPPDVMRQFHLNDPHFVVQTAIADVWRVEQSGMPAALKIYRSPDLSKEGPGFNLLRALDGQAAVRVLGQQGAAVLLEWLDGPALGDLSRTGKDAEAALHLGDVAAAIHAFSGDVAGLTSLDDWCAALFEVWFAPDCPATLKADVLRGKSIARDLLATTERRVPLHGDLHHDNVKMGADGWKAFDAKGLLGDKTFELANAFRNPIGADVLMRDPARFLACADLWANRFDVDRMRLMRWAAAKVALSIAWRTGPVLKDDNEADLLSMMLAQLPES